MKRTRSTTPGGRETTGVEQSGEKCSSGATLPLSLSAVPFVSPWKNNEAAGTGPAGTCSHQVRGHRLGVALERARPHARALPLAVELPEGRGARQHLAGPRGRLQPGSEVHRLADRGEVLVH